MERLCNMEEFEKLSQVYIELMEKYKTECEKVKFYGDQLLTIKAENALLKQKLKLRKVN